ncbi:WD40 repeat-like protein [Flagelloscypha sp. PMI_526]|nr:WD40 repeat-like protein [Flagelloscypha sp. PMI_526]
MNSGERMLPSANLGIYTHPLASTHPIPQNPYFLHLSSLNSTKMLAASTSSPLNTIQIYDKRSLDLVHAFSSPAPITFLRTIEAGFGGQREEVVMSSSKSPDNGDGSIEVWDSRSGGIGLRFLNHQRGILSFDVAPDGMTVVGGTDMKYEEAFVCYWDPRQPAAPLVTHSSTHSDDITSVHFSRLPNEPLLLLSGSSDGLVSISNATEPDEDETVLHVGNMGSSVSQTGWITGGGIWSSSDMESFSCWSNELDHHRTVDIRLPSVHSQAHTWVTDYLIGCHSSPNVPLGVFVGSNEGDIALVSTSVVDASASWTLERVWTNGHMGIVRCCLWDEENGILFTGGEDAKLNIWSCSSVGSI